MRIIMVIIAMLIASSAYGDDVTIYSPGGEITTISTNDCGGGAIYGADGSISLID